MVRNHEVRWIFRCDWTPIPRRAGHLFRKDWTPIPRLWTLNQSCYRDTIIGLFFVWRIGLRRGATRAPCKVYTSGGRATKFVVRLHFYSPLGKKKGDKPINSSCRRRCPNYAVRLSNPVRRIQKATIAIQRISSITTYHGRTRQTSKRPKSK